LSVPTAADLRAAFDRPGHGTIGIEEELMVLDPQTLDLAPQADELLAALDGDSRFKPELVAAQIELITPPASTVGQAGAHLREGRRRLSTAAGGELLLAGAGTHPFTASGGVLSSAGRYRRTREEYGCVARRQLVFGLHAHVRVRGAERAVAVYNGMRSHLPELAALAANAPFHEGRDTGLASIRPKISELLPRQGVPPALSGLEELADALAWSERAGALEDPGGWWWELRLHPLHGTIEVRVPDQQTTVAESCAIAGFVHALVLDLAARHDGGEPPHAHPAWRIEENRWSACRHGLDGTLADLDTGEPRPARERLRELIARLEPAAATLGCSGELSAALEMTECSGAERQRSVAAGGGAVGLTEWLADRFCA
jgi:carboxylate-amine ligase